MPFWYCVLGCSAITVQSVPPPILIPQSLVSTARHGRRMFRYVLISNVCSASRPALPSCLCAVTPLTQRLQILQRVLAALRLWEDMVDICGWYRQVVPAALLTDAVPYQYHTPEALPAYTIAAPCGRLACPVIVPPPGCPVHVTIDSAISQDWTAWGGT